MYSDQKVVSQSSLPASLTSLPRRSDYQTQQVLGSEFWIAFGGDGCVGVFDPSHQLCVELLCLLRHLLGKIMFFGKIVTQVEELVFIVLVIIDQFIVAFANDRGGHSSPVHLVCAVNRQDFVVVGAGEIEWVVPEDGTVLQNCLPLKDLGERLSVDRLIRRQRCAGNCGKGRCAEGAP